MDYSVVGIFSFFRRITTFFGGTVAMVSTDRVEGAEGAEGAGAGAAADAAATSSSSK